MLPCIQVPAVTTPDPPGSIHFRRALRTPGTQFNIGKLQQPLDGAAACTPSLACDTKYNATEGRASVSIYAINLQLGALGLCSGAAILVPSRPVTLGSPLRPCIRGVWGRDCY